ncbi:hypothetical protein BJ742DRAFT_839061 [Cladochytrium replicatum]|nr:hypothetical protein BJ742DRAFT_839061 [Cladochytrium replicatum]
MHAGEGKLKMLDWWGTPVSGILPLRFLLVIFLLSMRIFIFGQSIVIKLFATRILNFELLLAKTTTYLLLQHP